MFVRGIVSTVGTGTPVPNGTQGEMRLLSDNTLVATLETTDGWFEHEQNGNPGPFKITWDYASRVKIQYSKVTGPSGPMDVAGLPLIFRAFVNGVITGIGNDLNVTSAGSSMNLTVPLGAALVQGILYDHRASSSIAVTTAHASLARIDTIVVEVVPPGAGEDIEGKSVIKIVAGTAAASPVAPTLTQTTSLYQYPLKDILVGTGVVVIGSDKLTDRRTYARTTIPAASIGTTELADLSVTTAKLAANAVTGAKLNDNIITQYMLVDGAVVEAKIASSAVVTAKIADNAVTYAKLDAISQASLGRIGHVYEGATLKVTAADKLIFDADDFNVTDSGSGDATIALAAGSGVETLMPVSEYVATGGISSGSRTLVTLGVGPLTSGVTYAIQVTHGVTIRNSGTTGTVTVRANIDGGTQREHEFQNGGGVPRWCPVTQSAEIVGDGGSIDVVGSVVYESGNTSDIRAGEISVIAIPHPIMVGA